MIATRAAERLAGAATLPDHWPWRTRYLTRHGWPSCQSAGTSHRCGTDWQDHTRLRRQSRTFGRPWPADTDSGALAGHAALTYDL